MLAADPETGERGPRQVTAQWVHNDELVALRIGDAVVTTTEDHPFWNASDKEWQRADALDVGEIVLAADGDLVTIEGIDWSTRTGGIAYNLTVAELNTYFVVVGDDQVLVHNDCWSWAEEKYRCDGGELWKLTNPSPPGYQDYWLGPYASNPDGMWKEHVVIIQGGKVYDEYTEGTPVEEWLNQWEYRDLLTFEQIEPPKEWVP